MRHETEKVGNGGGKGRTRHSLSRQREHASDTSGQPVSWRSSASPQPFLPKGSLSVLTAPPAPPLCPDGRAQQLHAQRSGSSSSGSVWPASRTRRCFRADAIVGTEDARSGPGAQQGRPDREPQVPPRPTGHLCLDEGAAEAETETALCNRHLRSWTERSPPLIIT